MQNHDVVPIEPQVVETGQDVVHVGKEIRKDDHERSSLHHEGDIVQLFGNGRFGGRLGITKELIDSKQNTHRGTRRQVGPDLGVENG